ncbi:hypothetical protein V2J09_005805 [Rumex salicifolius]
MSANHQMTVALMLQLAKAADGAFLGVGLAYVAVRTIIHCFRSSSALKKVRDAPSVSVSDLRSILSSLSEESSDESGNGGGIGAVGGEMLVIVRGTVDAKSAVEGGWANVRLSSNGGQNAVIVQKVQSCIYNGCAGFIPWTSEIRSVLARAWKEESSYTRTIPFVLKQGDQQPQQNYLVVNMEGSKHPLPLVTVYHQMKPVDATLFTFLQAFFGREYAVSVVDEEKILPTGKEITAVGICCLKGGVPEIKSCKDLPYFLSDMGKHQMIADLSFTTKVLTWSSVVLCSLSIGVLGYAIVRNWSRWRDRRDQARRNRDQDHELDILEDGEEEEVVPEGQLCVLCLQRRRQSAFVPCGHMITCYRCSLLVERDLNPKCPICRQPVHSSVRIYAS